MSIRHLETDSCALNRLFRRGSRRSSTGFAGFNYIQLQEAAVILSVSKGHTMERIPADFFTIVNVVRDNISVG
jgi:hypothetical protein